MKRERGGSKYQTSVFPGRKGCTMRNGERDDEGAKDDREILKGRNKKGKPGKNREGKRKKHTTSFGSN